MRMQLTKSGDSKSIVLPTALLEQSGIGDEIEIVVEAGRIVIMPAAPDRQGWYDGYNAEADVDAFGDLAATDADCEEWEW